jgi:diaminopimelate decarboxylase
MATRQMGEELAESGSATWSWDDPDRWFWQRPGLEIRDHRLVVCGRDAESLARAQGTPLYVYDLARVGAKVTGLRQALERTGLRHEVRFALKANHNREVLEAIRACGAGIDACSPAEVELALQAGFTAERVSFTGTNLTDGDLDRILATGAHINVDLLSQLRRYGRKAPGTAVGIRINPRSGGAYGGSGETLYSGSRPTKFGIYLEDLDEALTIAREHDLTIDTLHMHVGDGFLGQGLDGFEAALEKMAEVAGRLQADGSPIREINAGGGLGVPQRPGDRPLDVDAYAGVLARTLGSLDVTVTCEPGDYLVKDSAVLLCEVVTVERRLGTLFVGPNIGWNVMPDPFIYRIFHDIVLCRAADAPPEVEATVAGHINEGDDLFAEAHPLPPVEEGDIVAIVDVGGYHQGMTSKHCLRPAPPSLFLNG